MKGKKIIRQLHLWLGLSSGLVVFIISVTGCLYAFKTEIEDLTQPYRYVQTEARPTLVPSAMKAIGNRILPGKNLHSVTYRKNGRAAILTFYHDQPAYYYLAFVNPYSGEVLAVRDMSRDFFYQVLQGHYYLWLPPTVGQPIAATATLLFVVMLISGLILWWPKNKAARQQRFSVKWQAPWRRRNYDLHAVAGFYVTGIAALLALTGLVWGFQWFARSVYWASSGGKSLPAYYEPASVLPSETDPARTPVIDQLWFQTNVSRPADEVVEVHFPETATASIAITTNPDAATFWQNDTRYYDQYSRKELPVSHVFGRFDTSTSVANKIARLNYDVHVGAIMGLPGKVIAFLASLISASLPVTGFLIWWGRRKKNKPRAQNAIGAEHRVYPPSPMVARMRAKQSGMLMKK
jgi:uncharacterized iron-regulated membrane protein